jgi:formylglycine-generating enzyme required for sulfatase activity
VIRGGSWNNDAFICRAAYRYYNSPGYQINFLGFRVLRSSVP